MKRVSTLRTSLLRPSGSPHRLRSPIPPSGSSASPLLDEMVTEGLVTLENAEIIAYRSSSEPCE